MIFDKSVFLEGTNVRNTGWNRNLPIEVVKAAIEKEELGRGQKLSLFRDKDGTVLVAVPDGRQIGILPKSVSEELLSYTEDGTIIEATLTSLQIEEESFAMKIHLRELSGWTSTDGGIGLYQSENEEDWDYVEETEGIRVTRYNGPKAFHLCVPDKIAGKPVVAFGIESTDDGENDRVFSDITTCCNIYFPSTVTEIGEYAFDSCIMMEKFIFPASIKKVGAMAFSGAGIKDIYIPATIEEIGAGAFLGCRDLLTAVFARGLHVLPDSLFAQCDQLRRVVLPGNLDTIGPRVFFQSGLIALEVPPGVRLIGFAAFALCDNLRLVALPASVENIDGQAFDQCNNLTLLVPPESFAYQWAQISNTPHRVEIPASRMDIMYKAGTWDLLNLCGKEMTELIETRSGRAFFLASGFFGVLTGANKKNASYDATLAMSVMHASLALNNAYVASRDEKCLGVFIGNSGGLVFEYTPQKGTGLWQFMSIETQENTASILEAMVVNGNIDQYHQVESADFLTMFQQLSAIISNNDDPMGKVAAMRNLHL